MIKSSTSDTEVVPISKAAIAVAVALAFLPFLRQLTTIDLDRCAPLIFLPAFWLVRKTWRSSGTLTRSEKCDRALLVAAMVFSIIASLFSAHQARAFVQLASWAWVIFAALMVRQIASRSFDARAVLMGISAGSTLGCLAVWLSWREGTSIYSFPFYSHGRLFGLHMMIGTLSAVAWLQQTRPKNRERVLAIVVAVINCGGMLWSGGRAPLVGAFIGVLVWWWFSPRSERGFFLKWIPVVMIAGLVISLLRWSPEPYLGWWGAIERSRAATSIDSLSSTRLSFWQVTWTEIIQRPWLGHGADSYRFILPKQDGDQPHNWILQFLLDFGIVGGAGLSALLVRQAYRGLRNPANTPARRHSLSRSAAAGFTGCLAAGLLDGVFYHAILLIPASVLAGLASPAPPLEESKPHRSAIEWIGLGLTGALLVFHNFLFVQLIRPTPPEAPNEVVPQLLRAYPSVTFGVHRWIEHWRPINENAALDWALWASNASDDAGRFHVSAAIMYADRGDFVLADEQMAQAVEKVHWLTRPSLIQFRASIKNAASSD